MKSYETHVSISSDYYVYTPSMTARSMFFYPLQCGHFEYEPGYRLHREAFDSFLLLYASQGSMKLTFEGQNIALTQGQFLLLDCYQPHAYQTDSGCDCLWCHFDGPLARAYYEQIHSHLGTVFSLEKSYPALDKLRFIYQTFEQASPIREPMLSKYLTDILTLMLLNPSKDSASKQAAGIWEETISYINEHFSQDISVEELASLAGLSQYHFIRSFKKETGLTPHQYVLHTRIAAAQYLLKNTTLSIKDICFHTGFSCESVFCSAFKKSQGITPTQYRDTLITS